MKKQKKKEKANQNEKYRHSDSLQIKLFQKNK